MQQPQTPEPTEDGMASNLSERGSRAGKPALSYLCKSMGLPQPDAAIGTSPPTLVS